VVESTIKDQTGAQPPLAQPGGVSEYAPDAFGLHRVVVRRHRGNCRMLVDVEMVRCQEPARQRVDDGLLRRRLVRCCPPGWAGRGAGGRLIIALIGATGWGQPAVTKASQRGERAIAMSILVYLLLLQCRPHDSPTQGSWSVFTLKWYFMQRLAQAPRERCVKRPRCKGLQEHKAA
jgi:hypothetical protein